MPGYACMHGATPVFDTRESDCQKEMVCRAIGALAATGWTQFDPLQWPTSSPPKSCRLDPSNVHTM